MQLEDGVAPYVDIILQRAVLSQICCFVERKVVLFQILLDGAEPRDAGS